MNLVTTYAKKAQKTAMKGTQMICKVVALCASQASPFDITSVKASKKTRAPIAMAQQAIMTLNEIGDCILIIVALYEVNVGISAIKLIYPSFTINTLPVYQYILRIPMLLSLINYNNIQNCGTAHCDSKNSLE
jgi:hypothetical protein